MKYGSHSRNLRACIQIIKSVNIFVCIQIFKSVHPCPAWPDLPYPQVPEDHSPFLAATASSPSVDFESVSPLVNHHHHHYHTYHYTHRDPTSHSPHAASHRFSMQSDASESPSSLRALALDAHRASSSNGAPALQASQHRLLSHDLSDLDAIFTGTGAGAGHKVPRLRRGTDGLQLNIHAFEHVVGHQVGCAPRARVCVCVSVCVSVTHHVLVCGVWGGGALIHLMCTGYMY